MEEYTGCRKPGINEIYVTYATYLIYVILRSYSDNLSCHACPAWLSECESSIIYERKFQSQVLYVVPVTSILGRLPVVPVGTTGTIPYFMRREARDFPGASCDSKEGAADGCRWWYINTLALKGATSQ